MSTRSGTELEFADLPGRRSADPLRGLDSKTSLRIVELERSPGRVAHRHPLTEEVVYVAAGSGDVWIDGKTHAVTPGDIVHIPVGLPHATVPAPGETMRLVCFFPHPKLSENIEDTDIEVTEREETK